MHNTPQNKCVSDGSHYLSNPPQLKCKNCGQFWFAEEELPDCKLVSLASIRSTENKGTCLKCGLETQPLMLCKCLERKSDGSWRSNSTESSWEDRFDEEVGRLLTLTMTEPNCKPFTELKVFISNLIQAREEEWLKKIQDIAETLANNRPLTALEMLEDLFPKGK